MLAVSANRVDAYEGGPDDLRSIAVAGVPESLEDALGSEIEARGLSFRSDKPVPGERALAPIYHGHDGASDERALDRERFHRVLVEALETTWGREPIPILLAAEVRTAAEFRKHANLPGLLDEELRGNPEDLSPAQLRTRAWPIVEAALDARERELAASYEKAAHAAKTIDGDLDALALAAIAGRVRRLWVEEHARVGGRIDETTGRLVGAADRQRLLRGAALSGAGREMIASSDQKISDSTPARSRERPDARSDGRDRSARGGAAVCRGGPPARRRAHSLRAARCAAGSTRSDFANAVALSR